MRRKITVTNSCLYRLSPSGDSTQVPLACGTNYTKALLVQRVEETNSTSVISFRITQGGTSEFLSL